MVNSSLGWGRDMKYFVAIFLFLFAAYGAAAQTEADYPAVALKNSIWPSSQIPVCWEQQQIVGSSEAGWVEDAITRSWQAHGNIEFVGWQLCDDVPSRGDGIRIAVEDVRAHVKGLGRHLDGVARGMVLNFTFRNFRPNCRVNREHCIRKIAMHEFGHALGFTHEQNREPETHWCRAERNGTRGDLLVTPYDFESIMNYCNPKSENNGQLSKLDIEGVKALYPHFVPTELSSSAWYKIVTRFTGQCIHVQNANSARRNSMWQWPCANTDEFEFQFERVTGDFFRIRTRYPGMCLHVQNGPTTAPRKELWQWECGMSDEFLFTLPETEDGWNMIKSKSGTCFHVANGPNRELRKPLWSWKCVNQPEFYFHFELSSYR